jgi:hypothetical protein
LVNELSERTQFRLFALRLFPVRRYRAFQCLADNAAVDRMFPGQLPNRLSRRVPAPDLFE